jgi:hypothetical protein
LGQCGQLVEQSIGSKETTMRTRRFERITLAQLLVGGYAVVFGLIEHSQAQPVNIPRAPPSTVINPSSPNTVPQPSYKPLSPATPSTVPGFEVNERPTAYSRARSHWRAPAATAAAYSRARSRRRASAATAASIYYRAGPIVIGPPPVAYSYIGYGYPCAWQRSWDGYWFRTSPCSW